MGSLCESTTTYHSRLAAQPNPESSLQKQLFCRPGRIRRPCVGYIETSDMVHTWRIDKRKRNTGTGELSRFERKGKGGRRWVGKDPIRDKIIGFRRSLDFTVPAEMKRGLDPNLKFARVLFILIHWAHGVPVR